MIKRALKRSLMLYLAAIVISCTMFPNTVWRETKRDLRVGVLVVSLAPILFLPAVTRSYWQFVQHRAWPFDRIPNAVMLDELIAQRGRESLPGHREITLDLTPKLHGGQEGRLLYVLEIENAYVIQTGGFPPVRIDRPVVRVGQYFCLATEAAGTIISLRDHYECMRLIAIGSDSYVLQRLGERQGQGVVIGGA